MRFDTRSWRDSSNPDRPSKPPQDRNIVFSSLLKSWPRYCPCGDCPAAKFLMLNVVSESVSESASLGSAEGHRSRASPAILHCKKGVDIVHAAAECRARDHLRHFAPIPASITMQSGTRTATSSTRPGASPMPKPTQVNTQTKVIDAVHGRILCIADVRGRLSSLNDMANEAGAKAIIHTGDFGFFGMCYRRFSPCLSVRADPYNRQRHQVWNASMIALSSI